MELVAVPVVAMAGISAHLAVYHLLLHLRRSDENRLDLYFAASAAIIALYDVFSVLLYDATDVASGIRWQRMQLAIIGWASLTFIRFVDVYSGGRGPRSGLVVAWLGPVLSLVALFERRGWLLSDEVSIKEMVVPLFGRVVYREAAPGPLFVAISLLVPYLAMHLTIAGLRMRRAGDEAKNRASKLLLGAGLFVFGLAHDAAVSLGWLHSIYLLEYAWTGMIVLIAHSVMNEVLEAAAAKHALAESRERLAHAQRLESVGELAGRVAHDLNNMLTPVISYAELAQRKMPAGSRERLYLDHAIDAAERAAALTQQLLAFGRRQVLEVRAIDLAGAIRELEPLLARLLPESVELRVIAPASLPPIEADVSQLDQVWMNLVANARDAMPEGGTLEIELSSSRASTGERWVLATVRDTGVGMDPAVASRIFEPFYTTKARGRGTGLGLSTVHGIVQQHAGRIEVESREGDGTTFRLAFPVTAQPVDTTRSTELAPTELGGTETILVVDDDDAVRRLAVEVLTQRGYAVQSASSDVTLRALLARWSGPLDLLLTDVVLADTDGPRVHAAVASVAPEVACVYMSGHADDVLGPRGVLTSQVHFLRKPFREVELLAKVRAALDRVGVDRGASDVLSQ